MCSDVVWYSISRSVAWWMMFSLLVLFSATLVPVLDVHGSALTKNDIDAILNIIQSQKRGDSSSDSSSSGEDLALRRRQLFNILQQSLYEGNGRNKKDNRLPKYFNEDSSENDNDLNQLFVQNIDDGNVYLEKRKLRPFDLLSKKNRKRTVGKLKLKPSTLLESNLEGESLSEYSKIFVVLNPDILKTNQNKKKLTNLLMRLLSKSSGSKNVDNSIMGQYNRRVLQRRYRKDSAEGYGKDSVEEKPKRNRYNYGGGGGGGGGRTAIPYIRNRGDIYVRDRDN